MSLVIALAASRQAAVGADRRAIAFLGACPALEDELYSGRIRDDQELLTRAKELGAVLQISDGREKVWRHEGISGMGKTCGVDGILVGEVTEISARLSRRRRIYVVPGASLQVDITSRCTSEQTEASSDMTDAKGGEARIREWGGVGCIVFGNRFTQKLAFEEISQAGGRVNEALIKSILASSWQKTASVSREYTVLSSDIKPADARAALFSALEQDCRESGWKLASCALQ
jgi:hypothetical protein